MWDKTGEGKTEGSEDTKVVPRGRSHVEASQQEKMLV